MRNKKYSGILKESRLTDFKMKHDFDFVWGKNSIYTDKYITLCDELSGTPTVWQA